MTQDTGWQVLRRWLSTSANLVDEIQRLYLHPKSMPGEDEIRSGWPDRHGRRCCKGITVGDWSWPLRILHSLYPFME